MKKYISLFCALAIILLFICSCTAENQETEDTSQKTNNPEPTHTEANYASGDNKNTSSNENVDDIIDDAGEILSVTMMCTPRDIRAFSDRDTVEKITNYFNSLEMTEKSDYNPGELDGPIGRHIYFLNGDGSVKIFTVLVDCVREDFTREWYKLSAEEIEAYDNLIKELYGQ